MSIQLFSLFIACINLEASRLPRELPGHFLDRVLVFATVTFSVSLLYAPEAVNILVLVFSRFPSWACRCLLAFLLAFALVTLLAFTFLFTLHLVQSSDVHRPRRVHQRCSRKRNVADLFADHCVRVESAGVHHEVVQDIRAFVTPLCTSATFNGSARGVPVLDEEIRSVE